jgi:hypothetical protein
VLVELVVGCCSLVRWSVGSLVVGCWLLVVGLEAGSTDQEANQFDPIEQSCVTN